jgi:hypothetical protein
MPPSPHGGRAGELLPVSWDVEPEPQLPEDDTAPLAILGRRALQSPTAATGAAGPPQRPVSKLAALQQQKRHIEELTESLQLPAPSSSQGKGVATALGRVPAERDADPAAQQAAVADAARTRRWQWLKAAEAGTVATFEYLCEQESAASGRDAAALVNTVDAGGDTALHRAAALGHTAVVAWLLQHGAAADILNARQETPMTVAAPEVLTLLAQYVSDTSGSEDDFGADAQLHGRAHGYHNTARGSGDWLPASARPPGGDATAGAAVPRHVAAVAVPQRAPATATASSTASASSVPRRDYVAGDISSDEANTPSPAQHSSFHSRSQMPTVEPKLSQRRPAAPSLQFSDFDDFDDDDDDDDDDDRVKQGWERTPRTPVGGDSICERSFFICSEHGWIRPFCRDVLTRRGTLCFCRRVQGSEAAVKDSGAPVTDVSMAMGEGMPSADSPAAHEGPRIFPHAQGASPRDVAAAQREPRAKKNDKTCCEVCYFEFSVILAIFINSIFLAAYDPLYPDSTHNRTCDNVGKFFTIVFTIEMLIKMIDQGVVFGRGTYLRDGRNGKEQHAARDPESDTFQESSGSPFWNWLDLVVVGTGYLDFIPGFDNQFGVLRTIRLMRPLRAIGAIKGLKQQVEVLMMRETLENIGNVCLLMIITFSVFSIVGVRFFGGVLRGHCYDAATLELRDEEEICNTGKQDSCGVGFFCSKTEPMTGDLNENPNFGIIGFDTFGQAMMTVFVCTTLEGWTGVMYMVQDGYSDFAWMYFVLMIVAGSVIIINLFLAVISSGYEESMSADIEAKHFNRSAFQCIDLIRGAVHNALIRPCDAEHLITNERVAVGLKVKLSEPALQRLKRCRRTAIYNMSLDTIGTVAAIRPNSRVRIRGDRNELCWHDLINVTPAVPEELTKGAKREWAAAHAHAPQIDQRVTQFLGFFGVTEDTIDEGTMDGQNQTKEVLLEMCEFTDGFKRLYAKQEKIKETLHYVDDHSGNFELDDEAHRHQVVITDKAVMSLLEYLTTPQKGRDKEWQERMLERIFKSMDRDADGNLTRKEFYDAFVNPRLTDEDDVEMALSTDDVSNEKLKGKNWKEVFKLYSRFLSHNATFAQFITWMVFLNCIVLAIDYHGMPECSGFFSVCVMDTFNLLFTFIFLTEMIIKLVGLTPAGYIKDTFNIFDGTIVALSVIELMMPGDSGGISVFRAMRILRIFKAAARFENLKKVILTIVTTLPELANFFILLSLFVFFYAVMGLQMFGGTYASLEELYGEHPRVNFDTFWWSTMTIFQVLTVSDAHSAPCCCDAMREVGNV